MDDILRKIRQELLENANEATRLSGQRFFKEAVQFYGVKSAVVARISKASFKKIKDLGKEEVFKLCDELWRSGYMEEGFIACHWSYCLRKSYEPGDFSVFEHWIGQFVKNWASCDTLCNHTVGTFIEMYPEFLAGLKVWALSRNRWMRRAAAVSLIIPAKEGKFLGDIFEIADILLLDGDDLVQKGYGWMLKAASHSHQQEVFAYIVGKKATMPRTALRYAIEKMPKDLKAAAMKKG